MHSIIFQISTKPIAEHDFLNIDLIEAGEMASISYVDNIDESERELNIKHLAENILPKGMFTKSDNNTLIYNGGFNKWSKTQCDHIMTLSVQVTPSNVMKWMGPIGELKKAITNPLGTDTLFVTEFYRGSVTAECSADLMEMVSLLSKGDKLYIGTIASSHN